jgi:hypothetical protein
MITQMTVMNAKTILGSDNVNNDVTKAVQVVEGHYKRGIFTKEKYNDLIEVISSYTINKWL